MANAKLITTPLGRIDLTKLDFFTIKDEIRALIRKHDKYSDDFSSFFESDAAVMLIDLFSQIAHMNNLRIDFESNELSWINSETEETVLNYLPLIDYDLNSVEGSITRVTGSIASEPGGVSTVPIVIPAGTQLTPTNLAGDKSVAEFLAASDDYTGSIILSPGIRFYGLDVYAGITDKLNITVNKPSNFMFKVNRSNIIDSSIQVFLNDGGEYTKLDRVTSFIAPLTDLPVYTVRFDFQGQATIIFGNRFFGGQFDGIIEENSDTHKEIIMYYRYLSDANGQVTNYAPGSINEAAEFYSPTLGRNIQMQFLNTGFGTGGENILTVEEVKQLAPLTLRTARKAVTNEDYEIFIGAHRTVKGVNVVTPSDQPNENVPIFYTYVYVSPHRNSDAFIPTTEDVNVYQMPAVLVDDDAATYEIRMLEALESFYNLRGMETAARLQSQFTDDFFSITEGFNDELRLAVNTDDIVSGFIDVKLTADIEKDIGDIAEEINSYFLYDFATVENNRITLTSNVIGDGSYIQLLGDDSDINHNAILTDTYSTLGFELNAFDSGDGVSDETLELMNIFLNNKIIGIEALFRPVTILPVKLELTIYYSRTADPAEVEQTIMDELYFNYSYESMDAGAPIRKSDVIKRISALNGVEYMETDFTDVVPSKNQIAFLLDEYIIKNMPDDFEEIRDNYTVSLTMVRSS